MFRNGTFQRRLERIQCGLLSILFSSFSISLDYAYCLFETVSIREAALEAIPQSKRSFKIAVTLRHKQCDIAVKNKACLKRNQTDVAFARYLSFSNCAEQRPDGLYWRQSRPPGDNFAHR